MKFFTKKRLSFIEEVVGQICVITPVLGTLFTINYFEENKIVYSLLIPTGFIILYIYSAIIDMFMILKRLGVTSYSFKKRDKWYKELYYLIKYGFTISEGRIGSIDGEAAYTRKRYTSLFYDKYLKNKNDGNLRIMVEDKKNFVYSKSFIMKNNIPKNLTDEKICETWREPGTDKIYYGTLIGITMLNIIWYYFLR